MKRNHKRLSPIEALAKIRTTEKTTLTAGDTHSQYSGLTAFRHRYEQSDDEAGRLAMEGWSAQAAQVEIKEAPLRKARAEKSRVLQEMIQNDSPTLYSAPSSFLAATTAQVGDGEKFVNHSPEEIKATIRKTFSTWEDSLSEGKLTASGKQKMQNVARVNIDCDPTEVSTWQQIFTLLRAANEMTNAEFVATEQPEPAQRESFDDVLNSNDTNSRSGRQAVAAAAMTDMQGEAASAFQIFSSAIAREFNYSFSDEEVNALIEVMRTRNLSFVSQKAWATAKSVCIRRGLLPRTLMSKLELFEELVEKTDTRSYEGRQELKRQERLLLGR